MPILETLYKTKLPEETRRAEYYQLELEARFCHGKHRLALIERHGWFDGVEKDAKLQVTTLNPDASEGFENDEDASRRYNQQLRRRASEGFVHSFSVDFDSQIMGPVCRYRRLAASGRTQW
jgi:hypothetical protein